MSKEKIGAWDTSELEALKKENKELKEEVKRLREIIKGPSLPPLRSFFKEKK